jgi:hypothetical protein
MHIFLCLPKYLFYSSTHMHVHHTASMSTLCRMMMEKNAATERLIAIRAARIVALRTVARGAPAAAAALGDELPGAEGLAAAQAAVDEAVQNYHAKCLGCAH